MQNTRKIFKAEIDFLNTLLCAFVVLIHLFTPEMLKNTIFYILQKIMFFAIFGFVFLSAVKFFVQSAKPWKIYVKSCVKKIIVPYLAVTVIYFIVLKGMGCLNDNINRLPYLIVTGGLSAQFYFVPMIVQFYVLMPMIRRAAEKFPPLCVISAALVINVFTVIFFYKYGFFNRIFGRYLLCYVLGAYAGLNYNAFVKFIKAGTVKILFVYIALLMVDLSIDTPLTHQLITVIYMPTAVLFWYSVSLHITEKMQASARKFFGFANGITYQVYLWHVLAVIIADVVAGSFDIPVPVYSIRFFAAAVCILAIAVCSGENHRKKIDER